MRKKEGKRSVKFLWVLFALALALPMPARAEEENRAASYDRTFGYTGTIQSWTVPVTGLYQLEVWGASGGDGKIISGTQHAASGGSGGYSCGYAYLDANATLYIVVGGAGTTCYDMPQIDDGDGSWHYEKVVNRGGYNGGGQSVTDYCEDNQWGYASGSGGGATHIATRSGGLSSLESHKSDILIVAGGGGGASAATGNGYETVYNGGSGGGLTGGLPSVVHITAGSYNRPAADQSSGWQFGAGKSNPGGGSGGGGGGWYGGHETAGGSGYTGGVPDSLTYNGITYRPSSSTSSHTGNGRAVVTYLGPVQYRQIVQVCYENADGTFTDYDTVVDQGYDEGAAFTWTRAADSTYQAAGLDYTVTGEETTQITVYRKIYSVVLDKAPGIGSVSGAGDYKAGQTVDIDAEALPGYRFSGWMGDFGAEEKEYSFEVQDGDIILTASAVPIEYNIKYDLNGGTDSGRNPLAYTIESDDILLVQPTRSGYTFTGWSGSNGETCQESVLVPKGSTGDREYIAHWQEDEPVMPDGDGPEDDGDVTPLPPPPAVQRTIVVAARPSGEDADKGDGEEETVLPETVPLPVPIPTAPEPGIPETSERVEVLNDPVGVSGRQWDHAVKIIAATAGAGSTGGGLIFFAFFWIFRKCKIYDGRNDKQIGKALIRRGKKGMFTVRIPEMVCERAGAKIYLVFGKNFVRANPDKPVKIVARGQEFYRGISHKIDLKI